MSTIKKIMLPLLLALALLLTGCATPQKEDAASDTQGEELEDYRSRIAELEAALQQQREQQYITNSEYEQTIRELQHRVEQLSGEAPSGSTPDDTMIFHYRVENGNAIITDFEGGATLVTIPASLDGYPVIAIGERAFEGSCVAAVVIPEGVKSIEWFAFYGCSALLDISIPLSVDSIGYAVFDGCENLTVVCHTGSYAEGYARSYGLTYITK